MKTERTYSILIWPCLAQLIALAMVAATRPRPEVELTAAQAGGLSAFYVLLLFATASLMLYLIKTGRLRVLKALLLLSLFYAASLSLAEVLASLGLPWALSVPLGAAFTWLGLRPGLVGNASKALLSSAVAYLFVSTFPEVFTFVFLGSLAVYDAYAIFRGPLGKMFSSADATHGGDLREDPLKPMLVTHGRVSMGLGDLFAYSLASASSTRMFGLVGALFPLLLLNAGVVLTLHLLYSRRRVLPGLTLPVALWLLGVAALSVTPPV